MENLEGIIAEALCGSSRRHILHPCTYHVAQAKLALNALAGAGLVVVDPSDEMVVAVALAEFQFEERARMAVGIKAMEWGNVSEVCRRNWLDRAAEGLKAMVRAAVKAEAE